MVRGRRGGALSWLWNEGRRSNFEFYFSKLGRVVVIIVTAIRRCRLEEAIDRTREDGPKLACTEKLKAGREMQAWRQARGRAG